MRDYDSYVKSKEKGKPKGQYRRFEAKRCVSPSEYRFSKAQGYIYMHKETNNKLKCVIKIPT